MAISKTQDTVFNPDSLYPLETVAEMLNVSPEWVKKHLVYSKECGFKKRGAVYLFKGSWIILWATNDFTMPSREDDNDES